MRVLQRLLALVSLALPIASCEGAAAAPARLEEGAATDFHSDALENTLASALDLLQTRGFELDGPPLRTFLVERDAHVQETPLRRGRCYVFAAVASSAITQLSIQLFDSDGTSAAEESVEAGEAATLFCPSDSGRYFLAITALAGNGLVTARRLHGPRGLDVRVDDLFRSREEAAGRDEAP